MIKLCVAPPPPRNLTGPITSCIPCHPLYGVGAAPLLAPQVYLYCAACKFEDNTRLVFGSPGCLPAP